ncbi:MAG: hypothetical protein U0174_00025 [Polyangiaceae bacterium]
MGTSAFADETSRAQAQALFDDGLKLMDAGRYQEACPKFVASNRLDPAGGTQMNVALCHEREGKIATAVLDYQAALTQATADKRKERESFAKGRLDALTPLVPKVVIRIRPESEARAATITLDGTPLVPEVLGTPLPLDPGPHQVEARLSNGETVKSAFSLKNGDARNITLGTGEILGGLAAPGVVSGENASKEGSNTQAPTESARTKFGPYFGWAGAGALVASAVTGSFALGNYISYKNNCADGRNYCKSQDGIDAASRTNTHAILSTIFLGVGAACLLVIPILPSSSGNANGTGPRAQVAMTPFGAQVGVSSAF